MDTIIRDTCNLIRTLGTLLQPEMMDKLEKIRKRQFEGATANLHDAFCPDISQ